MILVWWIIIKPVKDDSTNVDNCQKWFSPCRSDSGSSSRRTWSERCSRRRWSNLRKWKWSNLKKIVVIGQRSPFLLVGWTVKVLLRDKCSGRPGPLNFSPVWTKFASRFPGYLKHWKETGLAGFIINDAASHFQISVEFSLVVWATVQADTLIKCCKLNKS